MCKQILPTSTMRNTWRTVRACMLILGLKGLITWQGQDVSKITKKYFSSSDKSIKYVAQIRLVWIFYKFIISLILV